jgi:hypothetical protein
MGDGPKPQVNEENGLNISNKHIQTSLSQNPRTEQKAKPWAALYRT